MQAVVSILTISKTVTEPSKIGWVGPQVPVWLVTMTVFRPRAAWS